MIEALLPADWEAVRAIYQEGLATGVATLETEAPSWEQWDAGHLASCRLACRRDGRLLGWAALSAVSSRQVYRGVAEVSLYVGSSARRQGVGRSLLEALVDCAERAGLWTLQAGILAENEASLRLHRDCGFRVVGVRERLGQRLGRWHDVVLLERRL